MNFINNILKKQIFPILGILFFGGLLSCSDELPDAMDTSSKHTDIRSIRIVNAGENGDEVLDGVINENTKMITFPPINPLTDFTRLQLEAELAEGASLEQSVYNVVYPERVYTATALLKINNAPRTKEYFITFEQIAPPDGANFVDFQIHDFSSNPLGADRYSAFVGGNTRSVGFDGENVLIVPNSGAGQPHVLKMEDLRNGNTVPMNLNTTGVAGGGIFHWMTGYMVDGHILLGNLTSGSALKLYHYESPAAAPQTILDLPVANVPGVSGAFRAGDLMSASLTSTGNGFVYFADNGNAVTNNRSLIRVSVSNFTNASSPTLISPAVGYGVIWDYFNRVGTSSSYLYTTHANPIVVVDANGATLYAMPANVLPATASDPKIIEFNNSRYLLFATAPVDQGSTVFMYDITAGDDVVSAIRALSTAEVISPVFQHSLGTNSNNGAPVAQTSFHVEKDEDGNDLKLSVVAAAANNGFAVFEFNKKEIGD
ncbi:DUF4623 domain-containing protein [Sphingobacterium pedocola]|uniref:DUF4623 domain-containing protein n=1 Tax=Sphingobacterium pedocola TaxID=2082722 RepID=A0ABR9TBI8_9SPHI|nr:DUF4623 domain-containing protein [Sphingobacterium pedocola]MBE8722732.1 DUF4623 domain-containing protein [Sphingobacterium pedocola]